MEEWIKIFNYIGFPGVIGAIVTFIWKSAPVSNLTADIVESKLFSKEKRMLVKVVKYLFYTLIASGLMFILLEFLINRLESIPLFLIIILMIATILVFYFLLTATTSSSFRYSQIKSLIRNFKVRWIIRWVYSIQKQRLLMKFLILILYTLITYSSVSLYLSYSVIESGLAVGFRQGRLDYLIPILIFTFLFSLVIPALLKPALSLINWYNGKQIAYVNDEEVEGKRWYILYPVQKSYVLLGNEKEEYFCTEKKLVQKEELINRIIFLD